MWNVLVTLFLIDKTLAIIFLKTPTCFYHFAHLGAHSNLYETTTYIALLLDYHVTIISK